MLEVVGYVKDDCSLRTESDLIVNVLLPLDGLKIYWKGFCLHAQTESFHRFCVVLATVVKERQVIAHY